MNFQIVPAHDIPLDTQASIFNRAFAGYLAGWADIDAASLAKLICAQGIDFCHSRFVSANGTLTGFGYMNRTGNVSRLAGMGVVPGGRATGAAGFLVSHLLSEAKSRSDEAIVLEVFEQNLPGLALYRRHGFRELMRLFGWRRHPQKVAISISGALKEISLLNASQMRGPRDFPDIPWQTSRHAVVKLADVRAYQIDSACVLIGNPNVVPIRIHALLGCAGSAAARDALAAVLKKFPDNEFLARQVFPEELGPTVFEPLGFVSEPLNQILMRHDLQS